MGDVYGGHVHRSDQAPRAQDDARQDRLLDRQVAALPHRRLLPGSCMRAVHGLRCSIDSVRCFAVQLIGPVFSTVLDFTSYMAWYVVLVSMASEHLSSFLEVATCICNVDQIEYFSTNILWI